MVDRTGLNDLVFETMPSAYVAAKQTYLTKDDANQINQFAWYTKKHNDLLKLSGADAADQFKRLHPEIQKAMGQLFETDYGTKSEEDSKFFTKIKEVVTRPVGGLFEGLRDYTETVISNPFRQADAALRQTGDSWDETYNGEAYFDEERASKVENFYGPVVSKIAKLLASGKRPGEILLLLETDAEFDAFEKMIKGDEEFDRAVAEFDDAKVSFGRRMFGYLQPGAGTHGVQRWIYDRASGLGDLTYQIFADPLTYMTLGFGTGVKLFGKTVVAGSRSLKDLLESAGDETAYTSKLAKMFSIPGVRENWDRLGGLIDELNSKDAATRVSAANKIKEDFPTVTDEFKEVLRKGGPKGGAIKNADDAEIFFLEADNVHNLINGMGLAKIDRAVMPTWNTSRKIKSKIRTSTIAAMRGKINEADEVQTIDKIVSEANRLAKLESRDFELLQGGAELVKTEQKRRGVVGRVERLASRYPVFPNVNIGDDYAKSSELVFQMARTYLPRWHANGVRDQFEKADPYGRFLLLKGMYVQMGQSMGLTDTREGREFLSRQLENQFGGQYASRAFYKQETLGPISSTLSSDLNKIDQAGGFYRPGERAGASFAPQWFQSKPIIANVDLAEWQRMANDFNAKVPFARNGTFVGGKLDEANNHWGFFTLFPRNGMRSALEELLFYGLEGSVRDFLNYFKARGVSRGRRRTIQPDEQTLTAKIGYMAAKWSGRYSDIELENAIADKTGKKFAELQIRNAVEEIKLSPFAKVTGIFPVGRMSSDQQERYIRGLYEYRHMQDMGAELTTTSIQSAQQIRKGGTLSSPAAMESKYGQAEAVRYSWDMVYSDYGVKPAQGIKKGKEIVRSKDAKLGTIQSPSPEDTFGFRPFVASWHGSLMYEINADRVGAKIIIDNLDNPAAAVDGLVRYMRGNKAVERALTGSVVFREIAIREGQESAFRHMASNQYLILRNLLTDSKDEVIEDLVSKIAVRQADKVDDAFKGLDAFFPEDLETIAVKTKRAPAEVHGYQYILANENPDNVAGHLAMLEEKGYNFMQRQVDMTAREPIFISRYMTNRTTLDKAEKAEVTRLMNSGYTEDIAKQIADEKFSNISYKNAMERTIAYMDNPKVRSTLSFHMRNFARFYRATEDFYRRSARLGTNSPKALMRLRLGLVGLEASGFIHQDEEGEDYFVYPADDIIYDAVNAFSTILGRQPALETMPVEFTSKISMFTPSLDPDSALPAFNGPVAALPISAIRYIMGKTDMVPGDIEAGFNRYTMGVYSENSTFLDMVIPGAVRKGINILSAANADEGNKQIQSAFYSATAYNAAAGLAPDADESFDAQEKKRAQLLITAANVITIRNIIGFFAPASIQMEEIKDLPDYVLRTGTTRLSSEYYTIVNGLAEQGSADPWGEALAIFTRKNPGRLAYTIPRSENTGLIKINKTKEAADWVRENGAFIKEYGTTGVLFAPQIGEFDINAYSYLKSQGYTKNRDLDDFLMEMSTKKSRVEYDAIKQRWDERINSTSIDSVKSAYRAQSAEALRSFKNANPLLAQQLADFEFTTITQQTGVDELRRMLSSGDAPNPRLARQLQLMLKVYDSARSIWATGMGGEQLPPDRVREIRQDSIAQLERIAGNDPALQLAIDKLFAPVLERSRN